MIVARENAQALKPGDVILDDDRSRDTVVEVRGRYWLPFPGRYAVAVLVQNEGGQTREAMLRDAVPITVEAAA